MAAIPTTRRTVAVHPWVVFAARRVGGLLVGLAVLLTLTFFIVHLIPGDPVRNVVGITAPQSYVDSMRRALGLDQPVLVQYGNYLRGAFTGDLGMSLRTKTPVAQVIATGFGASASLAAVGFVTVAVIALPLGMGVGVLTAHGRHPRVQIVFTAVTGLLASVPGFLVAVGLVYLLAVANHWFPVGGRSGPASYVLPTLALTLAPIAGLARIIRVQTVAVLTQDFMRTARSKRLPGRLLYLRHALPNLITGALAIGGMLLPALLGGAVIIENVFNWPGIGTQVVTAVAVKDFPVTQAIVLILGTAVLVMNTVVDLVIGAIDPRSTLRED